MNRLQVLERGGAPQVEQVGAHAEVAGASSLAAGDVGEAVLDADALPQTGSPLLGRDLLAQPLLEPLVLGDLHLPSVSERALGALRAQWAAVARGRVELDRLAQPERLHFVGR